MTKKGAWGAKSFLPELFPKGRLEKRTEKFFRRDILREIMRKN